MAASVAKITAGKSAGRRLGRCSRMLPPVRPLGGAAEDDNPPKLKGRLSAIAGARARKGAQERAVFQRGRTTRRLWSAWVEMAPPVTGRTPTNVPAVPRFKEQWGRTRADHYTNSITVLTPPEALTATVRRNIARTEVEKRHMEDTLSGGPTAVASWRGTVRGTRPLLLSAREMRSRKASELATTSINSELDASSTPESGKARSLAK